MSEVDRLILEVAEGRRWSTAAELRHVLEHVAQAGFDPDALERARGELAGMYWSGQILLGKTMLSPEDRHYIKHVLKRREWPIETTKTEYVASVRSAVLDPASGVYISRFHGVVHLGIVGRSGSWRGPDGRDSIVVEYRTSTSHWVTAYQANVSDVGAVTTERMDVRWLRRPQHGG